MTVFNRATFVISQATRKTAADAKGIADEMLKKTQAMPVAPASEYKGQIQAPATNAGGKTPLKAPVKTSADLQAEMDRLTAERNGQAAPATTPPVKAPADDSAAIASAQAQRAASEASAKATRDASANRGDEAAFRSVAQPEALRAKFGPSAEESVGTNRSTPQYGTPSTGPGTSPADYAPKAPTPAPTLLDQAKGYGSQYVQAMKDLNPYAIGGTALAAGGTAALLHHLLSGKKTRKTAATSPLGALVGGGTAAEKAAARAAAIQANVDRARGQLKGSTPPPPSAAPKGNGPVSPLAGTPNAPRLNPPGPHGAPIPHAPVTAPAPSVAAVDHSIPNILPGGVRRSSEGLADDIDASIPKPLPSVAERIKAYGQRDVRDVGRDIVKNPTVRNVAAGSAGVGAIGAAGYGGASLAGVPGQPAVTNKEVADYKAQHPGPGKAGDGRGPNDTFKPKAPKGLWDKAKGLAGEYGDNLMKGDPKTLLATGGVVGGAALLHHLLTKRDRRSTEE